MKLDFLCTLFLAFLSLISAGFWPKSVINNNNLIMKGEKPRYVQSPDKSEKNPLEKINVALAVGSAVMAGGGYAYYQKRSLPSLIGASFLGGGMVSGGLLVNSGQEEFGNILSACSSVGLSAVGAMRYLSTGKVFPAIPLLVLGVGSSAYHLNKLCCGCKDQ